MKLFGVKLLTEHKIGLGFIGSWIVYHVYLFSIIAIESFSKVKY